MKDNKAAAKAVFEKDPGIEKLYFTTDGQAFASEGAAKTHQKELTKSTDGVSVVKNGGYTGISTAMKEETITIGDEAADEVTGEEAKEEEPKAEKTKKK